MALAAADPYRVLGVSPAATAAEIKAAYRALVKQHHPDAGGDNSTILALNAAWEVLGDADRRRRHDHACRTTTTRQRGKAPDKSAAPPTATATEQDLLAWLQLVVAPCDRFLAQVINSFPGQLKSLAADPYDDALMEAFCRFLEVSQARLVKVEALYRSRSCPAGVESFSLALYHCLSLVKDAFADLERYTLGYVDSYLRDARELLRQAKARRSQLLADSRQLRR
ncbi:DnaJ domain-containing protein [Cyanobium sp. Alchichica 3B3-8F6]|nr:DnaJ domain-containing protein [Cyanobium sp. Alchichica 3B3-8F6]